MTVPKLGDESQKPAVVTDDSNSDDKPNLKGDWLNFFLLMLLYTMQGMPLGIASAMPIILQSNKDVSYKDQALFSLVSWPFSLKLIWAPLVDALYMQKLGRRKSWLVPVQYLMGACFIYMGSNIDEWLPETRKPDILKLVIIFFFAKILAATQDIVVDGWALTMLKKNNVGYASTCNATGQVMGIMISSVFSILLTSEDFSNKYLRIRPDVGGVFTMKSLFYVWGVLFILITTLIAIFKKEKDNRLEDDHVKLNIVQSYSLLWDILKLPSIQLLAIALLSAMSLLVTTKVAKFTLFNRISDPRFGGTYMTLWNTLSCISMFSATTIAIFLINILTFKECSSDYNNNCSTPNLINLRVNSVVSRLAKYSERNK